MDGFAQTVPVSKDRYFLMNDTAIAPPVGSRAVDGVKSSSFICPVNRKTGKISREIDLSADNSGGEEQDH